jgi:hypothetical protein
LFPELTIITLGLNENALSIYCFVNSNPSSITRGTSLISSPIYLLEAKYVGNAGVNREIISF